MIKQHIFYLFYFIHLLFLINPKTLPFVIMKQQAFDLINFFSYEKKVSSAQKGCIYLIKNTVKMFKYYYNLIAVTLIYFCDAQLYFQHRYSSIQCHMIFRNHNNILIYCSRNISDYY